jgi:structural maintenance of chromosome 2
VQDLFHSVQLNVNNPHFLIMQGRINKVCNMKPVEIMSLLEEASGTRMYEKKKEKAMQTMEKKDQKLKEIEAVLNEEIQPAVEKLKKQCSEYHEWAELSSSRERLKRFLVAFDYSECQRLTQAMQVEMSDMESSVGLKVSEKDRMVGEAADRESQIRDLETEKEIKEGGEIKELQARADQFNMK